MTPLMLDSAIPLVFDGAQAQCFIVILRSTVLHSRTRNIVPGVRYTFIFRQSGGYSFAWPEVCRNAAPVDTTAGSTTVQNFIGNTDGYMDVHAVGTWREQSWPQQASRQSQHRK